MALSVNARRDEIAGQGGLIEELNDRLESEGYSFSAEKMDIGNGFTRIYISRGYSGPHTYDAFIDVRMGAQGPKGRTIEMSSSKTGNYGIPGFTRIKKNFEVGDTIDTFADMLRASYAYAHSSGKQVQEAFWHVYQHGSATYDLPASGVVLTRGSSSGERNYMANVMRSRGLEIHTEEGWGYSEQEEFVKQFTHRVSEGSLSFANYGYGVELSKHKAFVPITTKTWIEAGGIYGQTIRGPHGEDVKSLSTLMEARGLADAAFISHRGAKVRITPSEVMTGTGIRTGFTRSSVILPNESETRNVFGQRMVMADTPDSPGAAYVSRRTAFRTDVSGFGEEHLSRGSKLLDRGTLNRGIRNVKISGIGAPTTISSVLSIESYEELQDMMSQERLSFTKTEGMRIPQGRAKFELGYISSLPRAEVEQLIRTAGVLWEGGRPVSDKRSHTLEQESGEPFTEAQISAWRKLKDYKHAITTDRRAYPLQLGQTTLHVPMYTYVDESGKRMFSNVPDDDVAPHTTEQLVKVLKEKYGDKINIVRGSNIGSGQGDSIAQLYLETSAYGITPIGLKTGGLKAYGLETDRLDVKLQGVSGRQVVDVLTQEAKIPTRVLMSAFGIMNMQTQQNFIRKAYELNMKRLGVARTSDTDAVGDSLSEYVAKAYSGGSPAISLEGLSEVWNQGKGIKQSRFSADIMWSDIGKSILGLGKRTDEESLREQESLYRNYGIGILEKQKISGLVYSRSQKDEMQRLLKEQNVSEDYVSFKKISGGKGKAGQWRMSFGTEGGRNLFVTSGISAVQEYPFKSAYINPKAIMSMMEEYPETAKALNILGTYDIGGRTVTGWLGSLEPHGEMLPTRTRKGWAGIAVWKGMQENIEEAMSSEKVARLPNATIELTEGLGAWINSQISTLSGSTKNQINQLRKIMKSLPAEQTGLKEDVDATDMFLYDPSSMTILPRFSDISRLEVYDQGARSDKSIAYKFSSYLRFLSAAAMGASGNVSEQTSGSISSAKQSLMTSVEKAFVPETGRKRGNEAYRNILGSEMPGVAGGRYQGLTNIESLEAYASDDYIKKILMSNKGYTEKQARDIMTWLDKNQSAYLPVMVQRFPDVSGAVTWMPMMLKSSKNFAMKGVDVPSGLTSNGVFYMSQAANAYFVGDFDADPAMQLLLPMEKENNVWGAAKTYKQEFERSIQHYGKMADVLDQALRSMFGARGGFSKDSLDARRKNLMDYMETVGAGDQSSLEKRLGAVGTARLSELANSAARVSKFKMGMGVAYNRRTLTEDIMDSILSYGPESDQRATLRKAAYESGALPYQLYLDRATKMMGGSTAFETLLNSVTITTNPDIKESVSGKAISYGLGYYKTQQGKPPTGEKPEFDITLFAGSTGTVARKDAPKDYQSQATPFLTNLAGHFGVMDRELMTDEMIAWGLSAPGEEQTVIDALRNSTDRSSTLIALAQKEKSPLTMDSPYAVSVIYSAVSRAVKKSPALATSDIVKMPWVGGNLMTIPEITKSREYKTADLLHRIYVDKRGVMGPEDIDLIMQLSGGRMAMHSWGMARDYQAITHGYTSRESITEATKEAYKRIYDMTMSQVGKQPQIRMSELGALVGESDISESAKRGGWIAPDASISRSSAFQAIARNLGFGYLFEDKSETGAMFSRKEDQYTISAEGKEPKARGRSAFELGNIFETQFAKQVAPSRGLFHIGRLESQEQGVTRSALSLNLGSIFLSGTPDFIGLSDDGKMIVSDTKLAQRPPTEDKNVQASLKSNRYRLQLLAYAAAFEKAAKDMSPSEWEQYMVKTLQYPSDKTDEIRGMQQAASSGKFKLSIIPGIATKGTGKGYDVKTYSDVEVPYDSMGAMSELTQAAKLIKEELFSEKPQGFVAKELYESSQFPGYVPHWLRSDFTRTSAFFDPKRFSTVRAISKVLQSPQGRAGGGVIMGGSEPQRFRVGEAGPEEIEIADGNVRIIPTHELPENAQNRGYFRRAQAGQEVSSGGIKPTRKRKPKAERDAEEAARAEQERKNAEEEAARVEFIRKRATYLQYPDEIVNTQSARELNESVADTAAGLSSRTSVVAPKDLPELVAILDKLAGKLSPLEELPATLAKGIGPVKLQVSGARAVPTPISDEAKFLEAVARMSGFSKRATSFEKRASERFREVLGSSTKSAEFFAQFGRQRPEKGEPELTSLITWAAENLEEPEWKGPMAGFKEEAAGIAKEAQPFRLMEKVLNKVGPEGLRGMVASAPDPIKASVENFISVHAAGGNTPSLESISTSTAMVGAQIMKGFKTSREVGEKEFLDYFESLKKYTSTIDKLNNATEKGLPTVGLINKANEESLNVKLAEIRALKSTAEKQLVGTELAKQGGGFATMEEAAMLHKKGEVTKTDIDALSQYYAQIDKEQDITKKIREEQAGTPVVKGVQGIARHLLGTWGLMYLRTLGTMGLGSYQTGYQQSTEREEILEQTLGPLMGPSMPQQMMTERRYQSLMAASGNIPYRAIRDISGRLEASGTQDISGALLTGLGATGIALYGSNLLQTAAGESTKLAGLGKFGEKLAGWSVPAGLAMAGMGLVFNQLAYAARPEATAASVAGNLMRAETLSRSGPLGGVVAIPEYLGAAWKGMTLPTTPVGGGQYTDPRVQKYSEWYKENQGYGILRAFGPNLSTIGAKSIPELFEVANKFYTTPTENLADKYKRDAESVFNSSKKPTDINEKDWAWVLQAEANREEYTPFTDAIKFSVLSMMGQAKKAGTIKNISTEQLTKMMQGYAEGINYNQAATNVGFLSGSGVPSVPSMAPFVQEFVKRGYDAQKTAEIEAIAGFVSKLSSSVREFSGVDSETAINKLEKFKETYKNILGTIKEEPVARAQAAYEMARSMGLPTGGLGGRIAEAIGLEKNVMLTAEQQRALELETSVAEGRAQTWKQIGVNVGAIGGTPEQFSGLMAQYGATGVRGQNWLQGLMSGNAQYWTSALAGGMLGGKAAEWETLDIFGRTANLNTLAIGGQDISGKYKGTGLFQESLWQGEQAPYETIKNIFGEDWRFGGAGYGNIIQESMVRGEELGGKDYGGLIGLQIRQMRESKQYQRDMQGIQASQRALQRSFQTGVGLSGYAGTVNPQTGQAFGFNTGPSSVSIGGIGSFTSAGGGFWGQEDAARALANMQQLYNFQNQQQQLQMQSRQFYQNLGVNRQQTMMQRGWTAQDWGVQDQTRAMQWGWRQEDFQEQVRFLTGRDRRLAERQMKRETITYGLEGEQIDRSRERQKDLWELEDERYRLQIQQYEETKTFQEEVNAKMREFYLENKKLQDEQLEMQRAYWVEQQKLEEASVETQRKYNEEMQKYQEIQLLMNIAISEAREKADALTAALGERFLDVIEQLGEVLERYGLITQKQEGGSSGGSRVLTKALGGPVYPNIPYLVGDAGAPELYIPDRTGVIAPIYSNNPWNGATVSGGTQQAPAVQPTTISIYIGDKYLGEFVLDTVEKELRI